MRGKITAVLFIIVLLLTVAVVCTFLTEFDKQAENSAAGNNGDNSEIITVGPTPDAGIVETPHGWVKFTELIGVTEAELEGIKNDWITVPQLFQALGTELTMYDRISMM